MLLDRANQLSTKQQAGLLFACLVLGGNLWDKAVVMLSTMENDERDKALELFKPFAGTLYGQETAVWLLENWEYIEPWHLKLIEALKDSSRVSMVNKSKVL